MTDLRHCSLADGADVRKCSDDRAAAAAESSAAAAEPTLADKFRQAEASIRALRQQYQQGTLTRDPGLWPMAGKTGAAADRPDRSSTLSLAKSPCSTSTGPVTAAQVRDMLGLVDRERVLGARGDLHAEARLRIDAVFRGHPLRVALQFVAGRKNPRPVGVLLEGKRVDEGADVDRNAGIAVVAPGSADIMGALQQHERVDAVLLQFDGRAHAREAGADDDRFIVGLALGARGAALFDVHMAQVGV